MFDQPPFPESPPLAPPSDPSAASLGVIVPTRDRPERLARCLDALAAAREQIGFTAYVCDSSGMEHASTVAELCARHPFVRLVRHDRIGASAARNVGTAAASEELIVAVDDDVYVEPDAIRALLDAYDSGEGMSVVAGAVEWTHWTSAPLTMRRIGHGRDATAAEEPEFLVSALLLYPRRLAVELPWNERLWPYDDRYVTLLWRAAGARLGFAPAARARHDVKHSHYPVAHEADRIYVNLLDALLIERGPLRALSFEFLGFAACAKRWRNSPADLFGLIRAWARGHRALVRDRRRLREMVGRARGLRSMAAKAPCAEPASAAAKTT